MAPDPNTLADGAYALPASALSHRLFRPPLRAIMMPAMERKRAGEDIALLAGGCPHPSCSPVDSLAVRLRTAGAGASCALACGSASQSSNPSASLAALSAGGAAGAVRPRAAACTHEGTVSGELLDISMNYHAGAGVEELRATVAALQYRLHAPPGPVPGGPAPPPPPPRFEVTMSSGNSDALLKSIELLTDPGDVILAEAFAWPTTLAMCLTRGRLVVGVPLDADGLDVPALRAAAVRHRGRAKVLAVTPSGHNPTGVTYTDARRREVYAACRDEGLAILEDDPYCFLHMPLVSRGRGPAAMRGLAPCGERGQPYSFLALDSDPALCGAEGVPGGRVVRLDSFSKIFAPGLRLGWVSAPAPFVAQFRLLTEASNQHPSGVSQSVVRAMLREWGDDGLDAHLRALQLEYTRRRDVLLDALERAFAPRPGDDGRAPLASWTAPECGMLVWLRQAVWADTIELGERLVADGVACVPGALFSPPVEGAVDSAESGAGGAHAGRAPCPFLRLTFASASDEEMRVGCERIAAALRRDAAGLAAAASEP